MLQLSGQLAIPFEGTAQPGRQRVARGGADVCGIEWIRRSKRPKFPPSPKKTCSLADLFCGCGGLTLGVWEALRGAKIAVDVKLAIDASASALSVYRKNFELPEGRVRQMDILELLPGEVNAKISDGERDLKHALGSVDIVVAGPPCQGHSNLNNVTRRNDPRNSLYLKVARFVELVGPKIVLIENVPSVLRDRGNVVGLTIKALESLHYRVQSILFNASDLGLPQHRKRHLLVATKDSLPMDSVLHSSRMPTPLSAYLDDIKNESKPGLFYSASAMREENAARARYLIENDEYDLPNSRRPPCHRDRDHSYVSMYGRMHWDRPAQTITGGFGCMGQGRFVHPSKPRVITPHEAARIQGFPDFFDFSVVSNRLMLHEMIGNAVPPKISATVIKAAIDAQLL